MLKHRIHLTKHGAWAVLLLLCACTTLAPLEVQREYSRPERDTRLTCPVDDENRCALPSPLLAAAHDAATGGENFLNILDSGDDALVALVHLIRASRRTIDLQTFIWADDAVGHLMFRELLAAARRGVKVRLIADQMFSTQSVDVLAYIATAHRNLDLKLYNPVNRSGDTNFADYIMRSPLDFDNVNSRMHNKVFIVDGVAGTTGGRNYTKRYFNRSHVYNYLDRDVLALGAVVAEMQASFDQYWHYEFSVDVDQLTDVHERLFVDGKQTNVSVPRTPSLEEYEDTFRQANDSRAIRRMFYDSAYEVEHTSFHADSPGKGADEDSGVGSLPPILEAIEGAKESLVLQSPYFVLSKPTYRALKALRKKLPDIEYIISTNSLASTDAYYVYALSFKRKKAYVKKLQFLVYELKPQPADLPDWLPRLEALEKIREALPPVNPRAGSETGRAELVPLSRAGLRVGIHQKSIVIDDRIAAVGSHNLDPRSTNINTEAMLLVRDRPFARALRRSILQATRPGNSWIVARQQQVPVLGHVSGVLGSISRALPLFDIWPFRYTSSFELRSGESPLLPGEEGFYARYDDVGQFPGVEMSPKEIATRLISAFGGLAEPHM